MNVNTGSTNQRIMRVCRWLWDKHLSSTTLDEMDRADISHDFGTRIDLGMQLFFELYLTVSGLANCWTVGLITL